MTNTSDIKVAIVDDHAMIRSSLNTMLTCWGYQVLLQAINGKDFMQQLTEAILPDMCILDMNMPEMNGYETITVLKAKWPGIKIIAYSMDFDDIDTNPRFGADALISKSASPLKLKHTIELLTQPKAVLIE